MRRLGIVCIALAAVSCDPRKFDDLQDESWIEIAERDDTKNSGDFGIDVVAMPSDGTSAARFVVSAGSTGPGVAEITFDEKGGLKMIGANAEPNGKGTLQPWDSTNQPNALAAYSATQYLVGLPDPNALVLRYDVGLLSGTQIAKGTGLSGSDLAVGTLNGVGTAGTADVVTIGSLTLTIIPDADPAKAAITCGMKKPNDSQTFSVHPQSLVTGKFLAGATTDQIVFTTRFDTQAEPTKPSRVVILDASRITNGAACPTDVGFEVPFPGPIAMAVGDVTGDGKPDIVTGTLGNSTERSGVVKVYVNPNGTDKPAEMEITLTTEEKGRASEVRGNKLAIGDVDNDGTPDIVVADPGATAPNGASSGGIVRVYKFGTTGCATENVRGAACLEQELYDPDAGKNEYFGRGLAIGSFKSGAGTKNLLAVGLKDNVWFYFRVTKAATDPRQK